MTVFKQYNYFKLYDDIDMKTVKNSFCVPENTWQMYIFPYTIFAVTDEVSGARVSVNFGVSFLLLHDFLFHIGIFSPDFHYLISRYIF